MNYFWILEFIAFIRYYKFRLGLSVIGLTLGFVSLFILLNLQTSVQYHLHKLFSSLNETRFIMQLVSSSQSMQTPVEKIAWPHQVSQDFMLYQYYSEMQTVTWRLSQMPVNVVLIPSALMKVLSMQLSEGRGIHRLDEHHKVAVLGAEFAKQIRQHGFLPVSEILQIGNDAYEVIGTLAPGTVDPLLDFQMDNAIFVDYSMMAEFGRDRDQNFYVTSNLPLLEAQAACRIYFKNHFKDVHLIFRDAQNFMKAIFKQIHLTEQVLILVAVLNLCLGLIALVNILGLLVDDRRREIGIKICVGATKIQIIILILREAVILCALAGCLSLVLGWPAAYVLINRLEIVCQINWLNAVTLITVAGGFGLMAGILPAARVLKKHPVDLLKS